MQPSPCRETVRPWLPSETVCMEPTLGLRARAKSRGGAGARVDLDLVLDRLEVAAHRVELLQHGLPVRLQQREPLALVALAGPHEVGVLADAADRHAGGAQLRE